MGDLVSAERTFLDHLSNKQYIVSAECRLAENFLNAMKNRDLDMVSNACEFVISMGTCLNGSILGWSVHVCSYL